MKKVIRERYTLGVCELLFMKSGQKIWILIVIFVALLASFFALYFGAKTSKEEPEITGQLVRTFEAKKSDQRVKISAYGIVQPDKQLSLRSEVSGRVIEMSPNLVTGGIVKKNEVLLRLDQRDYLNIYEQEKAAVERAKFELQQEKGRQVVAKREWEQLGPTIKASELGSELALRKPHLREKEAALEAALSRLEKAELDVMRTVIRSVLDAVVLSESVEVGDYITAQNEIATLVGIEQFRTQVSVPVNKLSWIQMPSAGDPGSKVYVIQDIGQRKVKHEGKILRLLSNLDPSGRMARILVAVKDPLQIKNVSTGFPLLIGTYTRVEIEGPLFKNVFVIPRESLRENQKVWVKTEEDTLEIKDVTILQKTDTFVIVSEGLDEGDEIVTSTLPLAIPGMQLRTVNTKK